LRLEGVDLTLFLHIRLGQLCLTLVALLGLAM
jgi:hypothetical protein